VIFSRRLKRQYLWIDALCIFQDGHNNCRKQVSQMPPCYETAYVALAATASTCSNGGCFQKADTGLQAKELSAVDHSGNLHHILVRQHLPHWVHADPRYSGASSKDFPILDSGWILQERLLAPRIIHFGRHELLWGCMQCEAYERSILDHINSKYHRKAQHQQRLSLNNKRAHDLQTQSLSMRKDSLASR
jgi:Heterokaryon incompatibility protein (HET)